MLCDERGIFIFLQCSGPAQGSSRGSEAAGETGAPYQPPARPGMQQCPNSAGLQQAYRVHCTYQRSYRAAQQALASTVQRSSGTN
jgi:hypothetical protein